MAINKTNRIANNFITGTPLALSRNLVGTNYKQRCNFLHNANNFLLFYRCEVDGVELRAGLLY